MAISGRTVIIKLVRSTSSPRRVSPTLFRIMLLHLTFGPCSVPREPWQEAFPSIMPGTHQRCWKLFLLSSGPILPKTLIQSIVLLFFRFFEHTFGLSVFIIPHCVIFWCFWLVFLRFVVLKINILILSHLCLLVAPCGWWRRWAGIRIGAMTAREFPKLYRLPAARRGSSPPPLIPPACWIEYSNRGHCTDRKPYSLRTGGPGFILSKNSSRWQGWAFADWQSAAPFHVNIKGGNEIFGPFFQTWHRLTKLSFGPPAFMSRASMFALNSSAKG